MRKLFGLGLGAVSAITLASCSGSTTNLSADFDTEQLLASSMYAIGGAIDNQQVATRSLTRTSLTNDQYKQVSDSVKEYVDSVDKLMSNGLESYFNDSTTLDIEGITDYTDIYELTLKSGIYVMAYNKGDVVTESDDDGSESSANLTGVLYQVVDNVVINTYDLVGYEETETEEDEIETEFFIKATDTSGNYIKYEYSNEVESEEDGVESDAEIKFKSLIEGVKTYSKTELEIESDDGYEVSITDELTDLSGSYISEYEYYRSLDGEFDITYRYKGEDFEADGIVLVTEVDGVYTYTFVDEEDLEHKFEEKDDLDD